MNLTSYSIVIFFPLIAYLTSIARGSHIGRKHRKARLESFQGARFTKATHYLPLNGTTAARKLLDLRGNASGVPENGVKQSTADQIGYVLTLDGTDDFIELKNIKDQCIVDPGLCREGLSVAFWIKYNTGKFIISSGQYTDRNFGPGFRFICESCPKKKGPHLYRSRRFLLELSTIYRKWTILLDHVPIWWFHFAFTWNHKRGLKFYKNGQLFVSSSNPETVVDGKGIANDLITIGKPNSLMDMYSTTGYGDLSIAHLVIWTYELTKFDVEIAFLSALTKTKNSLRCCQTMKDDPCFRDPCRGGVECQQMEDRFKCICSDVNLNRACLREQKLPEPCMDNSEVHCAALAAQDGYCENNRKRMSSICPKSCNFCGDNKLVTIRTTQALSSSSLNTNAPIVEATQASHTVRHPLQSENRNAWQSARGGAETQNLQTLQLTRERSTMETILSTVVKSSYMQDTTNSRMRSKIISALGTARQVQSISGALSSRVLQTLVSPSSAVPRKSSSSASSAVWHNSTSTLSTAAITKDYSSSIITAMLRDLSSFTSPTSFTSTAFDSYSKSGSAKHNINSTRATTASSFATIIRFTSVQPSLPSSVAVQDKPILTCKVNNFSCACFNCHQARKNGKTCCQDVIDRTNIQQGVIMNMAHITVEKFHQKVSNVSHVLAEVILDSCISNSTRCLSNEKSSEKTAIRKKRSLETDFLEDFSSSNSIKTKKEADSDVFMSQTLSSSVSKEALHPNISSSKSNISRVDVIIYSISSKSGLPHRVKTAFYVTVTSNISGTNLAQVLDGKGLIQILRDKKGTLEDRLNLTIESFSASQSKTEPTSLPFDTTLVPNASPGKENQQTSLSTPQVPTTAVPLESEGGDDKGVSQSTLILIIGAAIGGLVLLVVLLVFILTRFYRQRKGEFVPDKTYPSSHSKQNGETGVEDVENISSFIDPSAPRITDVPHKPTRSQSSAAGGAGGKKPKKPMGVKITYKPPKWD